MLRLIAGIVFSSVLLLSYTIKAADRDSYSLYVRGAARTAIKVYSVPTGRQGTGFWVELREDSSRAVFITNKHLLVNAKQLKITFQLSNDSRHVVDSSTKTIDLFSSQGDSLFSVFDTVDLVAIVIPLPYKKGEKQSIIGIRENAFTKLSDLYTGEDVIFFGYPLGRAVNRIEPIFRSGRIAGVDSISNIVLLDAQAFEGSSGSPVFVDTKTVLGNTPTFVGVITGYVAFEKLFLNMASGEIEMKQTENSGLAVVLPVVEVAKVASLALSSSSVK